MIIAFAGIFLTACKERKFRESHRFQWGESETCYYVDQQTGDTVYVAMKYCTCCKR